MPDVLVKEVDDEILEALKERARLNGRSLQVELKTILEQAAQMRMVDFRALASNVRLSLSSATHSDSASLLAEDRQR
jgi:plasmid stability protein